MTVATTFFPNAPRPNGRGTTDTFVCPVCERPFQDHDEAQRVRRKYKNELAQLAAEAQAAVKERMAALEASIEEQTKARTEAARVVMEAKFAADQTVLFEKNEKLKRQVAQLNRDLDERTSNARGDGAEIDLFKVLRTAFLGDQITRVPKFVAGGDALLNVISKDRPCGKIIFESKNTARYQDSFATKLRANKLAAKADFAVLVTCVFPPGTDQVAVRENGEVILCHPKLVVPVTAILRRLIIKAKLATDSHQNGDAKREAVYGLFTGEGRNKLIAAIDEIEKQRRLDTKFGEDTRRFLKNKEQLYFAQGAKLNELLDALDDILRGEDE